jgi:oligogalacturonide lyase
VPSAGGVPERLLEEPRKVTHIQFSPASSRHICYCHELAQINGKQRLWLLDLDRGVPRCLFAQRPDQLVTHEWWSAEGRFVLGHLVDDYYADNAMQKDLTRRRHSIARVDVASGERELFAMEFGSQHYNSHPGGQYHLAEGDRGAHDFIYRVDLRQAKAVHTPLVRHGTRYTGQRSGGAETNLHVNPRGTLAYFNSDRGGCYNVYVLPL